MLKFNISVTVEQLLNCTVLSHGKKETQLDILWQLDTTPVRDFLLGVVYRHEFTVERAYMLAIQEGRQLTCPSVVVAINPEYFTHGFTFANGVVNSYSPQYGADMLQAVKDKCMLE